MSSPARATMYVNLNATGVLVSGVRVGVASIFATNTSASTAWIQIFDVASLAAVTIGTTVPQFSFPVADTQGFDGADFGPNGMLFENGLAIFATSGPANSVAAGTGVNGQVYVQ